MSYFLRHMLASDLAGAILGHEDALEGFRQWMRQERGHTAMALIMRRPLAHPRQMLERLGLPSPDFLIAGLGSELFDFALNRSVDAWQGQLDPQWDADRVRSLATALAGVTLVAESQSPRLVGLQVAWDGVPSKLEQVLEKQGLSVQIRAAGPRLDILPSDISEQGAIEFLARQLRIPTRRVIVCVGAESAPEVLDGDFAGVLTANSTAIPGPHAARLYRSAFSYADGVLDGVQYWREQWRAEEAQAD